MNNDNKLDAHLASIDEQTEHELLVEALAESMLVTMKKTMSTMISVKVKNVSQSDLIDIIEENEDFADSVYYIAENIINKNKGV